MEVTLFTDMVKCAKCGEDDLLNGFQKRGEEWHCRECRDEYDRMAAEQAPTKEVRR